MTETVESFNDKKLYLTLVFASFLLSFTIFSTQEAFAHGEAPSTCPNRYDGPITAAKIVARGMVYDPIANPGLTFKLSNEEAYIVTFTIHTQAQSSQGNSDPGTTWYSQNTQGFYSGSCVGGAGPDQDVIVTAPVLHSGSSPPEFTQPVQFSTLISAGFYYHVMWVNPDNTDPTPPFPPTNLSANAISPSQIDLSWTAPSDDGGSPITEYIISRSHDCNSTSRCRYTAHTNSTATTYSDTGLEANTAYLYRVYAVNQVGTSYPSNYASATTFGTVPSQPLGLTANAVSSSQIDLSWTAPSDDGGSSVIGYMIERSADQSSTWSIIVDNTDSSDTTYSDTGLSPNTTYTYRVSAINAVGTSVPSDTASATTPLVTVGGISVGPVTPPPLPSTNPVASLVVESADMSGMTFEGMWVELWRDGMIVQSGWTPFTAFVQTETQYVVFIQNWEDIIFDHWEDGTTNQTRAITLTQDATLTAFFQTGTTPTNNPTKT